MNEESSFDLHLKPREKLPFGPESQPRWAGTTDSRREESKGGWTWSESKQSPSLTQQSYVGQNKALNLNLNLTLVSPRYGLFLLRLSTDGPCHPLCPSRLCGQEGVLEAQGL